MRLATKAVLILAVPALVTACGVSDGPTIPMGDGLPTSFASGFRGSITAGPDAEFVCYASRSVGSGRFQYARFRLDYLASVRASSGKVVTLRVRFVDNAGRVVAAGNCRIPATPEARRVVLARLHADDRRRRMIATPQGPRFSGGCVSDGFCALAPLVVYAPAPGGGGGLVPWPDWGSSQGDAPSYGGGWDPGEPDQGGPCQTGSPAVDTPEVQASMDEMYQASNPAAPLGDRKEQYGWLVQRDDGSFRLHPLGISGNVCGLDANVPWPEEGPQAIVAFVHTHPYKVGEIVPACGEDVNRVSSFGVYESEPSDFDRRTSLDLGKAMGLPPGQGVPGMILDGDNIVVFSGTDRSKDAVVPRCGYGE